MRRSARSSRISSAARSSRCPSTGSASKRTSASRWRGCANSPNRSRCWRASAPRKPRSRTRFGAIIANYLQIVDRKKKLMAFTATYGQISPIIPYIFAAPFYFAGKITLGVMTQTASAFSRVEGALTFFVNYYNSLAEFRAVSDRLSLLRRLDRRARARPGSQGPHAWRRRRRRTSSLEDVGDRAAGRTAHHARCERPLRARRERAAVGPLGLGQVDAAARGRRPLALRRRRHRVPEGAHRDGRAAKALHPERHRCAPRSPIPIRPTAIPTTNDRRSADR